MSWTINYGFAHFRGPVFRQTMRFMRPEISSKPSASLPRIVNSTIAENPDGAPTWKPHGRGGKTSRGYFPSVKMRRAMPSVGANERKYIHICEADPNVERYWVQPHRLEIYVHGQEQSLVYFPDVKRELSNGQTEIVELKSSFHDLDQDENYGLKLALAEHIYRQMGWIFRVDTADDWYSATKLFVRNASKIAHDNTTKVNLADLLRLERHMALRDGSSTYFEVSKLLSNGACIGVGTARLHALVVKRTLFIDLYNRLLPSAPVRSVEGIPAK